MKVPPAHSSLRKVAPLIDFTDSDLNFDRFIECKVVGKVFEGEAKKNEDKIKAYCFDHFIRLMWRDKAVPPSIPLVSCKEGEAYNRALFVVSSMYRPENSIPAEKNRAVDKCPLSYLLDAVKAVGFSQGEAREIVTGNVVMDSVPQFNPAAPAHLLGKFSNILTATSIKAMGSNGVFTQEERELLFGKPKIVLRVLEKETLLKRLIVITTKKSEAALNGLVRVFAPDISISQLKFAEGSPPDAVRLEAAERVLSSL